MWHGKSKVKLITSKRKMCTIESFSLRTAIFCQQSPQKWKKNNLIRRSSCVKQMHTVKSFNFNLWSKISEKNKKKQPISFVRLLHNALTGECFLISVIYVQIEIPIYFQFSHSNKKYILQIFSSYFFLMWKIHP